MAILRARMATLMAMLLALAVLLPAVVASNLRTADTPASNWQLEAQHGDYLASRERMVRALQEEHHTDNHPKSWSVLETVNGLKNTEVAVFITSTTNGNDHFLWDRIIPSSRTWMRLFAHMFVVVEDNVLIRYALRQCRVQEFPAHTMFSCHNEPNYVLTRNCTAEYYNGNGICCKADEIISFVTNEHKELFDQIKYLVEGDDDTFFRPDQVLRWLAAVDNSGVSSEYPLVANAEKSEKVRNGGIWHVGGCKDVTSNGWYQPTMINKKALQLLAFPTKNYGFRSICNSFFVSQDVGFGPFFWLFGMWHIHFPGVEINGPHLGEKIFKPNQLSVHGIRHSREDLCDNVEQWPASLRYNQRLVVGCGDVNQHGPFHDPAKHEADMYDAWAYFHEHGQNLFFDQEGVHDWEKKAVTMHPAPTLDGKVRVKHVLTAEEEKAVKDGQWDGDKVEYRLIPSIVQLSGFSETEFSKHHDLQKEWVTFKPEDCKDKGSVKGYRRQRYLEMAGL